MTNFILFAGCLLIFFIVANNSRMNFTSPRMLFCMSFLVSSFLFLLNTNIWHYTISLGTTIFILVSILFFIAGSYVKDKGDNARKIQSNNIRIGTKAFLIFGIIELLGIIVRALTILEIVGNISSGDLSALRGEEVESSYEMYLKFLTPSIACIALYSIAGLFNESAKRTKHYFKPIILLIGYFLYCALSSARIEIIYLFVYIFVFYNLCNKQGKIPKLTPKFTLGLGIGVGLLIMVFFGLGFLTGKSQDQVNVFDNISIYACSSIGALDYYMVNDFTYNISNMFTLTMKGVYNFLPYLGINVELNVPEELNYVMYGDMNHNTNIYTCLRTPLHDYNYLGCLLFIFIEALVYNAIYKKAIRSKNVADISFLLYLYVTPFIIMSAVSERFCASFITITTIVFIVFLKLTRKFVVR